jgi:hypothetical protein
MMSMMAGTHSLGFSNMNNSMEIRLNLKSLISIYINAKTGVKISLDCPFNIHQVHFSLAAHQKTTVSDTIATPQMPLFGMSL